jgi:hypothetical protein
MTECRKHVLHVLPPEDARAALEDFHSWQATHRRVWQNDMVRPLAFAITDTLESFVKREVEVWTRPEPRRD